MNTCGIFNSGKFLKVVFLIIIVGLLYSSNPVFSNTPAESRALNAKALQLEKLKYYSPPTTDTRTRRGVADLHNRTIWRDIKKVMQNRNCTTCHMIGSTNGSNSANNQKVKDALPDRYNHPGRSSSSSCQTCHNVTVVGPAAARAWNTPPISQDFRGMSNAQLCTAAKAGAAGHSAQEHFKTDPLIIWALVGGRLPNHTNERRPRRYLNRAYFKGLGDWNDLINNWVLSGMPCP